MTLDDPDDRVREMDGGPVPLDAFLPMYEDPENADGVSLLPLCPVVPDPDDELVLFLLDIRHPGVTFEPADKFPGFHPADPAADVVAYAY